MRFMVDRRRCYCTGSTRPRKVSAQAGSRKRTRADFEREGALAEADAATAPTEPSRSLLEHVVEELEEFEAELAAVRATTTQAQRFIDHAEAKLNLSADVLERMKEEIGNMRTRALRLDNGIRKLRKKRDGWIGWIEEVAAAEHCGGS